MIFYYRTNEVELQEFMGQVKLNSSTFNLSTIEYDIVNNSTNDDDGVLSSTDLHHVIVYTICIAVCIIMVNIRAIMHFKFCMNSSKALHKTIFSCVLQAPMRFFDTNPSGKFFYRKVGHEGQKQVH